ncbi:MAG: SecY-interacting protein [Thalassotalea sp.]
MKSSNSQISQLLTNLNQDFIQKHQEKYQCLPKVEFEAQWLSPCQQGDVVDDLIEWQPVEITEELSFKNVETALDLTLNAEFVDYFSCYYSESVPAQCTEGYLELLFAWNKDDFDRLQQNVIGHVLMKQKLKQEITLFFAVTDDDNIILSVKNSTGEVCAEKVGKEPHKILAPSISAFLRQLTIAL